MNSNINTLKVFAYSYLLFLYSPVLLLPIFAFNDSTIISIPLNSFTFKWFSGLTEETYLQESLKNSLFVAISTSILSTCLGILASRASAPYKFFGKKRGRTLIIKPSKIKPYKILSTAIRCRIKNCI